MAAWKKLHALGNLDVLSNAFRFSTRPPNNIFFNFLFYVFRNKRFMANQGTGRFNRLLHAARNGEVVAPIDLRYLQKGVPKRGSGQDEKRSGVVSFLRGIYESVAETLPDIRDEGYDEEDDADQVVQLPQADCDPYAQAIGDPQMRVKLTPKTKGVRSKRLGLPVNIHRRPESGFEKRWLPPGHIREYFEQYLGTQDSEPKVHFSTFWRIWYEEFGSILVFRAASNHAMCATCVKHKLLIRGFAGHMAARRLQVEHYSAHLQSQYLDRLCYWDLRAQSRLRNSLEVTIIVDGADQAKFQYPRSDLFRSKDLQGFIRPRAHIAAALMHGRGILFTVSPADLRKDANASIELIACCLQQLSKEMDLKKVTLHLQSDNTSREVKNNVCLRFLASLVCHGFLAVFNPNFSIVN